MVKKIKSLGRRLILKLSGNVSHLKKGIKCKQKWYGNSYGGFYVCPEFLNSESIVYSFGIGEDVSFDTAIIEKHHCNIFGFDPTPKSISWMKKQQLPEKFHFFEYGISNKSGFVDFYLPKNPRHVSGSMVGQDNVDTHNKVAVEMKTLHDILHELHHSHIDVLKMDIEGGEYEVLENILNNNISVNQILIEFHDRFFQEKKNMSIEAIKKLNSKGYEIFAASDSFEEISLIKKSLL